MTTNAFVRVIMMEQLTLIRVNWHVVITNVNMRLRVEFWIESNWNKVPAKSDTMTASMIDIDISV